MTVTKCAGLTVTALSGPGLTRWCRWCCSVFSVRWRRASTVHSTLSATPPPCTPAQTEEKRRAHTHTQTQLPFREAVSNVTKACTDVMASHLKVTCRQLSLEPLETYCRSYSSDRAELSTHILNFIKLNCHWFARINNHLWKIWKSCTAAGMRREQ